MLRCPQCDHFNSDEATACERCGVAIALPPEPDSGEPVRNFFETEVLIMATTSSKIAAIAYYRSKTGKGLKESKEAVDKLLRDNNVVPKSGCGGMILLAVLATGAVAAIWST